MSLIISTQQKSTYDTSMPIMVDKEGHVRGYSVLLESFIQIRSSILGNHRIQAYCDSWCDTSSATVTSHITYLRRGGRQQRHPAVLREKREMLQVVLLDALVHVVDLEGADQCGQPEYLGGEGHSGLVVEHTLCIHQQHSELLFT